MINALFITHKRKKEGKGEGERMKGDYSTKPHQPLSIIMLTTQQNYQYLIIKIIDAEH